jgi:hypothetical protein
MDAKTRNLVLLGSLSLFRAGIAWILDHFVVGCGFLALCATAALGITERHWR